jgi:hypothetical protein
MVAIAVALVALIGAGCSNAPADSALDAGSSGGTTTNAANHEQAVKFAECMRDHGVKAFPDPDASGQLTIDGIANGSSLDPNTAAFKQALDACKDLEPAGFTGHKRSAQEQENALKFAQCIRDNGVPDFPDPTPDGPLVNVSGARSKPGLPAAMQTCRHFIADQLTGP